MLFLPRFIRFPFGPQKEYNTSGLFPSIKNFAALKTRFSLRLSPKFLFIVPLAFF
jgi:hypothetical protein